MCEVCMYWSVYGVCMECVWSVHGVCMECAWSARGVCVECAWSVRGVLSVWCVECMERVSFGTIDTKQSHKELSKLSKNTTP